MAKQQNQPDPRQQAEYNRYVAESARLEAERLDFSRNITEELKDQMNIRTRTNEADKAALSLSRQIATAASQNNVLLGNTNQIGRQILKDEKTRAQILREIAIVENTIGDSQSKSSQLVERILNLQEKQDTTLQKRQSLLNQFQSASDEDKKSLAERIKNLDSYNDRYQGLIDKVLEESKGLDSTSKKEFDKLLTFKMMLSNMDKILEGRYEEDKIQKKINDRMGVTGALVTGLGGIMQRLGLRSGIFNDAMEEARQTMHGMAEEAERGEKSFSKMQIAAAGLGKILKGVGKALTDPAVIAGKIADSFFNVDNAIQDLRRQTGQASTNFASLNDKFASAVDVLKVASDLTRETGINATAIFTPQDLGRLAEAKNLLGLSAEQANNLALNARVSGNTLEGYQESIVEAVNQYNDLNGSTIAHGQVLQDVLSTSSDIAMSLGGDAGRITKAAAAARKLGLELSKVDKIADSLMDFESSIQNELEAQLLTGKNINLAKARELALSNKLGDLADELNRQGVSAAEYSKMNRIQQESLAKALGMSREELGKSLAIQLAQQGASEEAIAAARGMTVEQLRSASVQEKLNKLVEKLGQSFSPILEILVPIVDAVAAIALPIAKGIASVMKWSSEIKILGEEIGKLGPILLLTGALVARSFSLKVLGGFISSLGQLGTKLVAGTAKLLGFSAAQSTTAASTTAVGTATKTSGRFIGSFFRSLSSGLMALANPAALLGLAAVTGAIIGIGFALKLAAPGIKAFGSVFSAVFGGLSNIIKTAFEGVKSLFTEMDPKKLYETGKALTKTAIGLAAFSAALAGASFAGLLGGGVLSDLEKLASFGQPLSTVGTSLTVVAAGIAGIATALSTLETEKLNELKDLVITTAFAAPAVAATGAITELVSGLIGAPTESSSNKELLAEIKLLRAAVEKGGNVYMDGNKVGQAMVLASTKLS